ncbi:uncharacterized protein [Engystomops pustulosus]|uniref:uncharacterized protein n=1 Tax=Engystomops pustulosus TaxID=76066 RepID=UPI003AFAB536
MSSPLLVLVVIVSSLNCDKMEKDAEDDIITDEEWRMIVEETEVFWPSKYGEVSCWPTLDTILEEPEDENDELEIEEESEDYGNEGIDTEEEMFYRRYRESSESFLSEEHGVIEAWTPLDTSLEESEEEIEVVSDDDGMEITDSEEEIFNRPSRHHVMRSWQTMDCLLSREHDVTEARPSAESLTSRWWIPKCLRRNSRSSNGRDTERRQTLRFLQSIFCCCNVQTLK